MSILKEVQDLYTALKVLGEKKDKITAELAEVTQQYDKLQKDLGDVFAGSGLSELRMQDGTTLGLESKYYGKVRPEYLDGIKQHLEAQGALQMLKPKKLSVDTAMVVDLPDNLKERVEYEIHHATLSCHLKELAERGDLTDDLIYLFDVHQKNTVKLS